MMNKLLKILILSSTLSFISGCGHAASKAEQEKGKTMIDVKNTQDWCLGRYTFKIPKEAQLMDESINFDTFKIKSTLKSSKAEFGAAIKEVENKYSTKDDFIKDKTATETKNNISTKIIWGETTYAGGRLPIEVFAFVFDASNNTLFKIRGLYDKKFEKESVAGIKHIVQNLKARNNNLVPKEKGICFKNGFIKDDGSSYKFTRQSIGFKFPKAPTVMLNLETEVRYKAEDDVVTRTEKNLKSDPDYPKNISTIKTLRKGDKTANPSNPTSGIELVSEVGLDGGTGIFAVWEHQGKIKASMDPLFSVTLDSTRTNSYVKASSIPNQNALQVYEAILNSIKKF